MSSEDIDGAIAYEDILLRKIETGRTPDEIYNYIVRREFRYSMWFIAHYGVMMDCGHYISQSDARTYHTQGIDVCWCAFEDEDGNPLEVDA